MSFCKVAVRLGGQGRFALGDGTPGFTRQAKFLGEHLENGGRLGRAAGDVDLLDRFLVPMLEEADGILNFADERIEGHAGKLDHDFILLFERLEMASRPSPLRLVRVSMSALPPKSMLRTRISSRFMPTMTVELVWPMSTRKKAWLLKISSWANSKGPDRPLRGVRSRLSAIVDRHRLFLVADGAGQRVQNELVSAVVCDAVVSAFEVGSDASFPPHATLPRRADRLRRSVIAALATLKARGEASATAGDMGEALDPSRVGVLAAHFSPDNRHVYIATVGPNRAYRLRGSGSQPPQQASALRRW